MAEHTAKIRVFRNARNALSSEKSLTYQPKSKPLNTAVDSVELKEKRIEKQKNP